MKRYALPIVLALLIVPSVLAQGMRDQRGTTGPPRVPQTLKMLNQRIPEVAFQDTPFESVMEWVAEFARANVVVRWETLESNGVKRDKAVSLKVKNLTLSQVLWMIMNEAGGADLKLAYRASGNLIVLSTADDLNQEMVVKVYDVSDLLTTVPRFSAETSLDPSQSMSNQGQGGSSNLFQNNNNNDNNNNDRGGDSGQTGEMGMLILLIRDTIEPDTWRENGGTGTIQAYRSLLVVRNTLLVHQRIGGYMAEGETGP